MLFIILLLSYFGLKANEISVTTYNVNYSFINKKLSTIIDSIDSDVVCLQETNLAWENIIRKDLSKKYPYMLFKHCCTAGGLAVLSKYPIIKTKYLKNSAGWFPALAVTIKKDQYKIQFLNLHLKPGLTKRGRIGFNAYFKAEEVHQKELTSFINELENDLPTIILGDFNENDKGKALTWLNSKREFKDALSLFDKKTKTWRFGILRGRYDHIVSNQLLKCTKALVYKLGKSDHFPVSAHFTLNIVS